MITQNPWTFQYDSLIQAWTIRDADGTLLMRLIHTLDPVTQEEIARHLVAAVNSCATLATEELEILDRDLRITDHI
tara:strand:- start:73 stop:300 length:228 start_codon:yes stop_codon:yes gene_type:complete